MKESILKITNLDEAKFKFKSIITFVLDSFFMYLIYSYIEYIGAENFNIIAMVSLLIGIMIRIVFYEVLYNREKDSRSYIWASINMAIFTFYIYILIIMNNFIMATNYIFLITIFFCLFIFIKIMKKREEKLKILNESMNLIFIMSFSCIIISNSFFDLKNFLFGITSYDSIENKVKSINIYLTLISFFLITHTFKEFLLDFGKRLSIIVSFLFLILVIIHIYKNLITNTIDYNVLTYYIIILLTVLLIINLTIEDSADIKIIFFKLSFILYAINLKLKICPDVFFAFIIFILMTFIILKKKLINYFEIVPIVLVVFFSFLYTEIVFYYKGIKSNNNYGGLLLSTIYIIGLSSNKKNQDFQVLVIFLRDLIRVFSSNKVHKSVKIKNERVYKRINYFDFKKFFMVLLCGIISLLTMHFLLQIILKKIIEILSNLDFINYIININILSKNLIIVLSNIWFQLFLISILCLVLVYASSNIYITNKRIYLIFLADTSILSFSYENLNIQVIRNKVYICHEKRKLFRIKDKMRIYNYINLKIKKAKENNIQS